MQILICAEHYMICLLHLYSIEPALKKLLDQV